MTTLHYILAYILISGTTGLMIYSFHARIREIIDGRGLNVFSFRVRKMLMFTGFIFAFPIFILTIPYIIYLKIINWRLERKTKRLQREIQALKNKKNILTLLDILKKLSENEKTPSEKGVK